MSATELIKQVAALPPQERTLFEQLFHGMSKGTNGPGPLNPPATWPNFEERLHRIYGGKVVPDSQSIIDEGRGDR
jgi:hypothetical protein